MSRSTNHHPGPCHRLLFLLEAGLFLLLLLQPIAGSPVRETFETEEDCKPFGVTFDIDGVISRAGKKLPNASETIGLLQQKGIPFTFLTNGGGKLETERAADLSKTLGLNIDPDTCIQAHTPYQDLAHIYQNKTVLVLGQEPCKAKEILHKYGFRRVITAGELHSAAPGLWPFAPDATTHRKCRERAAGTAQRLSNNGSPPSTPFRIDAAFVINDPNHWQLDLQILHDLLISHGGFLGSTSLHNGNTSFTNNGWNRDSQPHLFFSAADLEFSSSWAVPRFGQGAFLASLRGIWAAKTDGATFNHTVMGKPMASQYAYVERRERELQERRTGRYCAFKRNYMVGDNPESDIRGAMQYRSLQGTVWFGILVATGVWDGVSQPSVEPSFTVKGIQEAVELIGKLEGVDLTVDPRKNDGAAAVNTC